MKAVIPALLAVAVPLISGAGENLITNGDFSKGSSRWKGDENIEYETPDNKNKICLIEVDNNDLEFFQPISGVSKYKDLELTFRIRKSADYKGRGYQVRFIRDDGSYSYMNRSLPQGEAWKDMSITFPDIRNSSRVELKFIIRSGENGFLAFDDIVVTGKE